MSQFDVYINQNKKSGEAYPFIVDIQNSLISDIATRIVIPLGKLSHLGNESMTKLTRIVEYENEQFVLLAPQIASIPLGVTSKPSRIY